MAVRAGRGDDADVVMAGLLAVEDLAGAGLVGERPATDEAALEPRRAGARVGHGVEQPLRRRWRKQLALLEPRQRVDDTERRRPVPRVSDIAFEVSATAAFGHLPPGGEAGIGEPIGHFPRQA